MLLESTSRDTFILNEHVNAYGRTPARTPTRAKPHVIQDGETAQNGIPAASEMESPAPSRLVPGQIGHGGWTVALALFVTLLGG